MRVGKLPVGKIILIPIPSVTSMLFKFHKNCTIFVSLIMKKCDYTNIG